MIYLSVRVYSHIVLPINKRSSMERASTWQPLTWSMTRAWEAWPSKVFYFVTFPNNQADGEHGVAIQTEPMCVFLCIKKLISPRGGRGKPFLKPRALLGAWIQTLFSFMRIRTDLKKNTRSGGWACPVLLYTHVQTCVTRDSSAFFCVWCFVLRVLLPAACL